ncbi:MAG: diguanylate cyclase, partial [Rubrivivax sp.]
MELRRPGPANRRVGPGACGMRMIDAIRLGMAAAALLAVGWSFRAVRRLRRIRLTALVFEHSAQGIIVTDAQANVVAVNRAYCDMTGYPEKELLGRNPRLQQSGRHDAAFYREMWRTLNQVGQWQGEIWNRRKSGEAYPAWQNISVIRDRKGRVLRYVAIVSDITPVKAIQDRLDHLAHHDALTGLPNRLHFMPSLEQALARAERSKGRVSLMFVDLDHFKSVNDTLGHAAGDQLLIEVARRLCTSVRAEDLVARLGGDEFVVLLERLGDRDEAAQVASKLLAALEVPVPSGGQLIRPQASMGIAIYPGDGRTPSELLRAADDA